MQSGYGLCLTTINWYMGDQFSDSFKWNLPHARIIKQLDISVLNECSIVTSVNHKLCCTSALFSSSTSFENSDVGGTNDSTPYPDDCVVTVELVSFAKTNCH